MCFNSDLNAGHLPGVCHQPCESLFGCPGSAGVFPGTLLSASSWKGRACSCCHRVRRSKNNFSWCFHTWCLCYRAIWLLQSLCVRLLSKTVLRQTSCSTWSCPPCPQQVQCWVRWVLSLCPGTQEVWASVCCEKCQVLWIGSKMN